MSDAPHEPTRTAACSCGQLSATVTGEAIRAAVCHCLACQRRTGSVFGVQARFPRAAVQVRGVSREWTRVGDEGSTACFRFCPHCGSTVWWTHEGMPESVVIAVGAFADPRFVAPGFSVYEQRMHRWVTMPPGIERWD